MKTLIAIVLGLCLVTVIPYGVLDKRSADELHSKVERVQNEEVKSVVIDPKSQTPGFVYFYFNEGCASFNIDRIDDIMLTGDKAPRIDILPGRHVRIFLPSDIYGAMMVKDLFYDRIKNN